MNRRIFCVLPALFLLSDCSGFTAAASADLILDWNTVALNAIKAERTTPPAAARALAMMHGAMYDSVLATMETKPYRYYLVNRQIEGPASAEAAAARAAYQVLLVLFPGQRPAFDRALSVSLSNVPAGEAKTQGSEVGNFVASQYLLWRAGDLQQAAEAEYEPSYAAGKWRPTPPDYLPAMQPGWATLEPFAMESPSQFRQPPPPALDSEEYARDFEEVKTIGAANSEERTPEQTEIARFWEAGAGTVTPPGQWNQIAQILARQRENAMFENARMFALLNVALADAAIACWDMKYEFNCWRPVTAIRQADTDGNDATEADTAWTSLLTTPPFPSCTSGHSTFSGAAAAILALYFDADDIPFTAALDGTPGQRSFETITDAALEAGRSRIYGGIHFQFENEAGITTGLQLAQYVYNHYMTPNAPAAEEQPKEDEPEQPAEDAKGEAEPDKTAASDGDWKPATDVTAAIPPTVAQVQCLLPVAPPPPVCDLTTTPAPLAVLPGQTVITAMPVTTPQPQVTAYRYVDPLTGQVTLYYAPQPAVSTVTGSH